MNWKGVFPAVTTKFTADDQLDFDAFRLNLDAQLDAGVSGLVLGGTLGEASTLSAQEKTALVQAAVRHTAGRVPVVLNISEQTTKGAIQAAAKAKSYGANGLMLLPPLRYAADARETVTYLKEVAASTDLSIMIYNNPVDYKIEVTVDMFRELADCPNIEAIKESTRDVSNVTRLRNAFGDRYKILCGVDTLAAEELMMGADGWVAGLVCAFPAETVTIFNLIKAGRHEEALAVYSWFLPLLELDIHPKLVQYIKLAEVAAGIGTEYVRPPRLPLVGEERERILEVINRGLAKRPKLPAVEAPSHFPA
ncbi:MAG: dihydrodipicolinate synthase family protein [Cytophagales bacterium]|nr:dihydrodipicolinate synthase family protein [Cytophagales bacterium]